MKVEIRKVVHKNVNTNSFLIPVSTSTWLSNNKFLQILSCDQRKKGKASDMLSLSTFSRLLYSKKKVSLRVVITQPFSKTLYH